MTLEKKLTRNAMKNKVVVATKNLDKFAVVRDLLKRTGHFDDTGAVSLRDLNIREDFDEVGNVRERALKKAKDYAGVLREKSLLEGVQYVVGVDDAMLIEKEGVVDVDSKTITDDILSGERMVPGERLIIVRGFGMLDLKTDREATCEARTPFVFLGNEKGIVRKDGEYPLSYVLAYEDDIVPVVEKSWEEGMEYSWQHSGNALKEMLSQWI